MTALPTPTPGPGFPLETDEVLRIMDAAQVIRARRERLDEEEAFDRDGVIREIQVIYEGLGELVDGEVIGRALDEYLSQRHAYTPPPPGLRTSLARLYVARGRLTRRVLLPAAAVVGLAWVGAAAWSYVQGRALEREAETRNAAPILDRQERLNDLRQAAARLLTSIPALAEDPEVPEMMERLGRQVSRFADAGDVENLDAAVDELQDLEDRLRQEYSIVISGGRWRYQDDDPDVRNWYLIVEAVDEDGHRVALPVRNEETGVRESVSEWGERVPEEIYERVRADREDNGIIDDNAFGDKRRGYLRAERRFPDLGQITRW